jgi:transposase
MAKPLLPDELWDRIEPLLPPPKPRRFRFPGRKPIDHRKALTGILFVLKTGIRWEDLPRELGCGSGMTCWRRLRDWQEAGVWQALHELLLAELQAADQIDWSRAVVDSSSVRALGGGEKTGPNPTDRARPGSKHHLITDGGGIPLATILTGANAADISQLEALVDAIPPIRGKPGRPRRRPDSLYADRAYDSQPHRSRLRLRGITPHLARRGTPHGSGLGRYRWVVERTISWFHRARKLRLRTDWRDDIHEALMSLCSSMICWNILVNSFC